VEVTTAGPGELEPSPLAEQLGGDLSIRLVGEVFGENALAAALARPRLRARCVRGAARPG
jgi:hypothetical protein